MARLDEFLKETNLFAFRLMESEGELTSELEEEFKRLEVDEFELTDRYGYVLRHLEKEELFAKEREEEFKKRRVSAEKAREFLKEKLKSAMLYLKRPQLKGHYLSLNCIAMPPKVQILDEKQIPLEFMKTKTVEEPNKTLLKKALEEGMQVPGACLEEVFSLRLSPSKS